MGRGTLPTPPPCDGALACKVCQLTNERGDLGLPSTGRLSANGHTRTVAPPTHIGQMSLRGAWYCRNHRVVLNVVAGLLCRTYINLCLCSVVKVHQYPPFNLALVRHPRFVYAVRAVGSSVVQTTRLSAVSHLPGFDWALFTWQGTRRQTMRCALAVRRGSTAKLVGCVLWLAVLRT